MKRIFRIFWLTTKVLFFIVLSLLILYSAAFSIIATYVLYQSYKLISAPIKEVTVLKKQNPESTKFMDQCFKEIQSDTTLQDTLIQTFIPLDSISQFLIDAVLAAEDDAFYLHPGIDIASIAAAAEYNRISGKNKHGASTITQQMAKNLFLSSERSFNRKIRELVYSVLMERYLGKDRILELYLNYAQWGKNIFGCEAAARYYYKKSSHNLTRNESVWLAAVLAKPTKTTPHYKKSIFLRKRIAVIAHNLYLHRKINDEEYFTITGVLPPSLIKKDSSAVGKDTSTVKQKNNIQMGKQKKIMRNTF